jgi:hypothetical protein
MSGSGQRRPVMDREDVGCCGAFCGTCPERKNGLCKGCTTGYADGTRNISRARCAIKVCCVRRGHDSCADCIEYGSCATLTGFHGKNGYKYRKYRQALEYIRENGYEEFLDITDGWTRAYGRYPDQH